MPDRRGPDRQGLLGVVDGALTMATAPAVEAAANLLVDLDGARLRLPSVGGPVHIEIERFREAARIVRAEGETLERLDATLRTGGYTAEVYVGETRVALLGVGADPGRVSRWLGDGRTELLARGVVAAAVRRR
ncbi:hypothetical protein SAMN05216388_1002129 [Halorientalis persicus]|jgi:hypothetical protein|uniref:Uncharacterized protein n=1 Tax=Halorientalis persicus TaxID=1367881 RepID=A0A1H8EWJ6_9EURY|nr:hypothetical protein [Halorientalis persicus]SEN23849.1 hypothetical protein SAMN05216388_1002129 [Halorientalis persicus]